MQQNAQKRGAKVSEGLSVVSLPLPKGQQPRKLSPARDRSRVSKGVLFVGSALASWLIVLAVGFALWKLYQLG